MATDSSVNLLDLDLNLLIALDALLRERSVSRAARRLERSQPALSASLKRLRHLFQDDLLTRVGAGYQPTPLATRLEERVALVLAEVDRLFAIRSSFDPATTTREFSIHVSDYGLALLGPVIVDLVTTEAPGASLRCIAITPGVVFDADQNLRGSDGVLVPHGFIRELPHLDVHRDRWVLLTDRTRSPLPADPGIDDLADVDWVLPYHGSTSDIAPVRQLELLGVDTDPVVSVDGFVSLPSVVRGSARVTIIQAKLAERIADREQFRLAELPFDAVDLTEAFWWHPTSDHDPGHHWFRSLLVRAGSAI